MCRKVDSAHPLDAQGGPGAGCYAWLNPLAVTNKGSSDGKGPSAGASAEFTSFPRLSLPKPKSPKTGVPGLLPESPYRGRGYNFIGNGLRRKEGAMAKEKEG